MNIYNRLLLILNAIFLSLTIISISILITFSFRPIYSLSIDMFDIESSSGMSREDMLTNYNYLIDYMLKEDGYDFELPTLPSSTEGVIHFQEVKELVVLAKNLSLFFGMLAIILTIIHIRRKQFSFIRLTSLITIVIPIILGIPLIINFDFFFVKMHEIFFNNDYWIFNSSTDPVIKMLPEEFFFISIAFCLLIIAIISIIGLLAHKKLHHSSKF